MRQGKTTTVTFSMPKELNNELHAVIGNRGISRFIVQAIEQALKSKRLALEKAYEEAEKDPDRLKTIEDWKGLDAEG